MGALAALGVLLWGLVALSDDPHGALVATAIAVSGVAVLAFVVPLLARWHPTSRVRSDYRSTITGLIRAGKKISTEPAFGWWESIAYHLLCTYGKDYGSVLRRGSPMGVVNDAHSSIKERVEARLFRLRQLKRRGPPNG